MTCVLRIKCLLPPVAPLVGGLIIDGHNSGSIEVDQLVAISVVGELWHRRSVGIAPLRKVDDIVLQSVCDCVILDGWAGSVVVRVWNIVAVQCRWHRKLVRIRFVVECLVQVECVAGEDRFASECSGAADLVAVSCCLAAIEDGRVEFVVDVVQHILLCVREDGCSVRIEFLVVTNVWWCKIKALHC